MMWSTYPLATAKGMATCLVINRRDPHAPHGIAPVILTSGHLLSATPNGPFYLAFRQPRSGENPTIAFLELRGSNPNKFPFVRHPFYDIAVFRLEVPPEFAGEVSFPSHIDERAIGGERTLVRAGDEIDVVGFPDVFPGTEGAFPILRSGKVASHSAIGGPHPDEFLVNASVFAGDSGGPVFTGRRHGTPTLVGMVIERVGKKQAGVPLAVAVNAEAIRETLQLQAKQEQTRLAGDLQRSPHALQRKSSSMKLVGPPKTLKEMLKLWRSH
jgi:hypothetical protein